MTFLEWLSDELNKTQAEEIEIGFGEDDTLEEIL